MWVIESRFLDNVWKFLILLYVSLSSRRRCFGYKMDTISMIMLHFLCFRFSSWFSLQVIPRFIMFCRLHYSDSVMGAMASHITSVSTVCCLFRRRSKKTSKLRVAGLCEGNSPVTGEFPAQRASNAENFPLDDVIMWASSSGPSIMTPNVYTAYKCNPLNLAYLLVEISLNNHQTNVIC